MKAIQEMGVAELGRALDTKELSSVEATNHLLGRLAGHAELSAVLASDWQAVEQAAAGVPFREAYRAAAASADQAGTGRTPESSLAARVSPGAAADLRLNELRARWNGLKGV